MDVDPREFGIELSEIPTDPQEARRYWLSRTPGERLAYAEYLRRLKYGPAALGRMERTLEIVDIDWGT